MDTDASFIKTESIKNVENGKDNKKELSQSLGMGQEVG